jgi:hypothetical protein
MADLNGWRAGTDPTVRALRVSVVISLVVLLFYVVVVKDAADFSLAALLVGAIMAAIFGDITIALPFRTAERKRDQDDDDG